MRRPNLLWFVRVSISALLPLTHFARLLSSLSAATDHYVSMQIHAIYTLRTSGSQARPWARMDRDLAPCSVDTVPDGGEPATHTRPRKCEKVQQASLPPDQRNIQTNPTPTPTPTQPGRSPTPNTKEEKPDGSNIRTLSNLWLEGLQLRMAAVCIQSDYRSAR